jgi:hydrogenase maturation protease
VKNETAADAILIIGYGNTLRGDDGAGRRLAEELAARNLPRVRTHSVHQLTPELAEEVAVCGAVIFIDACLGCSGDVVSLRPIAPGAPLARVDHVMSPQAVLAYARAAFGSSPKAWLLTIPSENFAVGDSLSAAARASVATALALIERFVDEWSAKQ